MSQPGFCDHCGEDFRYDDTGGYNPPCKCRLNCRSCCEHGVCDGESGDVDDWQDYEIVAGVDYEDTLIEPRASERPGDPR